MKRRIISGDDLATGKDKKMKKIRTEDEVPVAEGTESVLLDENLLYEVLKHVDARTLGSVACVSKQWHKTAQDERLWELICTKQWANIGCGNQQLRSVVLALGGFRRLHALYLWPLAKPSSSSSTPSTSAWPCLPPAQLPVVPARSGAAAKTRWGKDEVHLSLSLLSIRYYEKMNFNNRADAGESESDDADWSDNALLALKHHELADRRQHRHSRPRLGAAGLFGPPRQRS